MNVLEKLNAWLLEGKITKTEFAGRKLSDIASAIEEYGALAYKELGYSTYGGFVGLLDRNIDYKRFHGQKWEDVLLEKDTIRKVLDIGVNDLQESGYSKEKFYYSYTNILRQVKEDSASICDEWIGSLAAFKEFYEENCGEGEHMFSKDKVYGPDTVYFATKRNSNA